MVSFSAGGAAILFELVREDRRQEYVAMRLLEREHQEIYLMYSERMRWLRPEDANVGVFWNRLVKHAHLVLYGVPRSVVEKSSFEDSGCGMGAL